MVGVESRGSRRRLDIAVIGSGISGLAAAWLLSCQHAVTLYEAEDRIGGHSNTVEAEVDGRRIAVDTGFIVYNEATYPNLTALFDHLDVPTAPTSMSFAVSLDQGAYEYAGGDLTGLFAQPSNIVKRRYWSMLGDLVRFYRNAPRHLATMGEITLEDYLDRENYGAPFRDDHLYPMAAAIWSTPALQVGDQPAAAFVRFCENHGLLRLTGRPIWRTVRGGSREYVQRLTRPLRSSIRTGTRVIAIRRDGGKVDVSDRHGATATFDHVIIATHADQALGLLADPSQSEESLLGAFRYARNEAVLHTDATLMPNRSAAWASWNYLSDNTEGGRRLSVTYWMNKLQPLGSAPDLFVTLNPLREPRAGSVISRQFYHHPLFDVATMRAQNELWSLQGDRNTWYCGAHFGAGFHEDGLQAGLAVAEDLGGVRRPWRIAGDSGRIARCEVRSARDEVKS